MNQLDTCEEQLKAVNLFFATQAQQHRHLRYAADWGMEAAA
jgi:hypothetical protein